MPTTVAYPGTERLIISGKTEATESSGIAFAAPASAVAGSAHQALGAADATFASLPGQPAAGDGVENVMLLESMAVACGLDAAGGNAQG